MSYDTYITMDTGAGRRPTVVECGNMTSNIGGMYRKAMPWRSGMIATYAGHEKPDPRDEKRDGLPGLSGMLCRDALPILNEGVAYLQDHPAEMRAMEPDNGWGSYEGALQYLRKIRDACTEHPLGRVEVSW